jgi:hypothetical protein
VTDVSIVWEDPPAINRGGSTGPSLWERRLSPLLERPGTWAKVAVGTQSYCSSATGHLRDHRLKVPPGLWEFAARTMGDGTGAIYARYLGETR